MGRGAASDLPGAYTGYDNDPRWWKLKPFLEPVSGPVSDWVDFTGASGDPDDAEAFSRQVQQWRADPFNPHLVARLRPGTYQKVTVMRYVENLLAWGDQLFILDTLETLNEATQLYLFAKTVLGDRPEKLESSSEVSAKTYAELSSEGAFDSFGNVVLENAFTAEVSASSAGMSSATLTSGATLTSYFCVPQNAQLLSFWDTVEDRLFKIRNGMNIDGVVRTLPLFQPPIDPSMLVQAAAAGIDIGTALDDLSVSRPHHRFSVLHGRATAIASSVRGLGGALLSALEKKDAEALANLRQSHEIALLDAVGQVREKQFDEARAGLASLTVSKATVKARRNYYKKLIEKGWLPEEKNSDNLNAAANALEPIATYANILASVLGVIPQIHASAPPAVETGGRAAAGVASAIGQAVGGVGRGMRNRAARLSLMAGFKRREMDWKQQLKSANLELKALDKQIAAAKIRVEIARREQQNHSLQVRHSSQLQEFMQRKFTNEELYDWMSAQLSALHSQHYQLALATAKKAQACYNHELGRSDSFIQSVYWDGLRKGLLAGDRLAADLERMDISYLENDQRELELTKTISLTRLDPMALSRLREAGECYFKLPEVLFDLDCPGHYNRRVIDVALSVACIAGGQGQVNLRLTQHASSTRIAPDTSDNAVSVDSPSYQAIVTSSGRMDAGVFIPDSNGPKYMPFERTGAVSEWHVAFANSNAKLKQLDWSSVSDVELRIRYTARDGGEAFRSDVIAALPTNLSALTGGFIDLGMSETTEQSLVAVSAKRDAPDAFAAAQAASESTISLEVGADRQPYFAVGSFEKIAKIHLLLVGGTSEGSPGGTISDDGGTSTSSFGALSQWLAGSTSVVHATVEPSTAWTSWPESLDVSVNGTGNSLDNLDDLIVILEFSINLS